MAKYDTFVLTENFSVEGNAGLASLTVLFEDGDNTLQVMGNTELVIATHLADIKARAIAKPTVQGALKYFDNFTKEQIRDVCRQYWTKQMKLLGAGKTVYANDLRQDILTAQNSSN